MVSVLPFYSNDLSSNTGMSTTGFILNNYLKNEDKRKRCRGGKLKNV